MRLDYTLYLLAAVFFLITAVSFAMLMEQTTERNLWVVTTVVLGLFSIGLGYTQRPKVSVAVQQPAVSIPQTATPQTPQAATMETPAVEAPKEEKIEMPVEAKMIEAPTPPPAIPTIELTRVKGIGEKRATQLKALGINNVDELAKISAEDVAKKLEISPKIVAKWIAGAKELVK